MSEEKDPLDLAREIADAYRSGGVPAKRKRKTSTPRPASARREKREDGQGIADILGQVTREQGWDERIQVQRLFTDWAALVGAEVAQHTEPIAFDSGVVEIRAASTAWARELTFLAAGIVRKLNEELGHGTVLRIEIRGPQAPSWKSGKRTVRRGRGPRDTYG